MNDAVFSNIKTTGPKVLLILLEARERLAALFSTWDEIAETADDDELASAAEAFRSIDQSIVRLGGPSIERTHEIMDDVLADLSGEIADEPAVASVILQHCASLASAY